MDPVNKPRISLPPELELELELDPEPKRERITLSELQHAARSTSGIAGDRLPDRSTGKWKRVRRDRHA